MAIQVENSRDFKIHSHIVLKKYFYSINYDKLNMVILHASKVLIEKQISRATGMPQRNKHNTYMRSVATKGTLSQENIN